MIDHLRKLSSQHSLPKFPWRRLVTILMTLLALGILSATIYRNRESLLAMRWELHPLPILGSFLVYTLSIGVAALDWGWMMRLLGSPASWRQHITIYYIALLMGRLPLPLGYVAGRLLFYDESTSRRTISFACALELALIMLSGAGVSLIFWPKQGIFLDWRVGVLTLILCLTAANPRFLNRMLAWLKVQGGFPLHYKHTLAWLAVSTMVWILTGSMLYLMIISFYPLPLSKLPLVIGSWSLTNVATLLMAFLPIGLGLRELAFGGLLSLFLPPEIAALIAILSRVFMTLCELVMAGIAYLIKEAKSDTVSLS